EYGRICCPWILSLRTRVKQKFQLFPSTTLFRCINMDLATYRMHEMVGSFSSAEGAERSRMRGFRWRDTISPEFLEEERRVFGDRDLRRKCLSSCVVTRGWVFVGEVLQRAVREDV